MRKNFGAKTWLYPIPVLIIGTYDGVSHGYWSFGERVGQAFSDGERLK